MQRLLALGLAVICLSAMGLAPSAPVSVIGPAWADDGDGGDGGDGDGGDDGGGGSSSSSSSSGSSGGGGGGGRIGTGEVDGPRDVIRAFRRLFSGQRVDRPPRRRARPAPVQRPERAPNEIIARGLTPEDIATLVAQGYVVLQSVDLASLATTLRRLNIPDGVTLEEARAAVRALPSGEAADFNHFYRTGQDDVTEAAMSETPDPTCDGLHCPARALINWPEGIGPAGCGAPVRIGMVDTGINPDHAALKGADIEVTRIAPEDYAQSDAIHGTAVAALLAGDPETRVPGLLPGLPLVAVDAFYKQAGDERADAFTLVRALDRLVQDGVQVINLSLAGPPNTVLENTLDQLGDQREIIIVAATGNAGPSADPAYPSAYDGVIAVTAVDRNGTAYRRAGRGPHVDLAAQGVEVWTAASIEGARWKTGTSFAAPYVTAAVVLWLQHDPSLRPDAVRARLIRDVADLGADGRDDIYGHGLLDLGGACPGPIPPMAVSAN